MLYYYIPKKNEILEMSFCSFGNFCRIVASFPPLQCASIIFKIRHFGFWLLSSTLIFLMVAIMDFLLLNCAVVSDYADVGHMLG